MRRSFLNITNKKNKFKLKQSILFVVLSFVLIAIGGNSVSALDLSQESIEITGKSDTTVVHDAGIGDLRITPNLEFNRLNDYISYKLVIKNNDGKRYRIVSITDDNSNEAIELTYSYSTEMNTDNKEIGFTVKYIKMTTSPLKTINVTIKIVDEDDASEEIPIIIPDTGVNTVLDAVSATTLQSVIVYILFATGCFVIFIIVKRKKSKKEEGADLRVPKTLLVVALLLGILPVAVIAASFENIYFTVNLTDVKLNGPYIITFDTDEGGTPIPPQTVNNGDPIKRPTPDPEREGYTFEGWVDENGDPYDFDTPVTGPVVIKADWKAIDYSISYDLAGGSVATANPSTYTIEDSFTLINPTRNGYDFIGWVGSNGNQPETTATVAEGTTGDLYFDAIWEATEYTITYEGGGTADPENKTIYTIETPTFELTNPTKDGAVFIGWTGSNGDTPQMKVEITQGTTGDLTYRANWHEILTVTYDVNGGSAVSPASFTVESGNEIGTLASTNKDHYDFLGWYLGDTKIESDYIVRDNITIKAKWNPIEYEIFYVLGPDATVDPNPTTYTIETPDFTLNNPVRAGHRFMGWTRGAGGTPEITTTVTQGTTGELHFNAHWLDLVVVEFNPDGGTYPNPDALELEPSSEITSLPETTRDGYNFTGWYLNDQKIELPYRVSDDGKDDITLVAKWDIITYNITYDLADDTADPAVVFDNPVTYNIESDTFTLNNPTREHYIFTGWTGTGLNEATETVTIQKGSIGDRSYTANWEEKEYTATFDTDGGTPATIDSQTKKYGETFTAPTETITKDGYTFGGWLLGSETYDFSTLVTKNIDLKAKWDTEEYEIDYNLDGGSVATANPTTYNIESDTFTLNNPTREHYIFTGWTGTGLNEATETVTIQKGSMGDRSYTATWEKEKYTATFKDGDTVVATQTKEYQELFTAPTEPTKAGYNFGGWLLGSELYTLPKPASENIELKAKWDIITYNIYYDLANGTIAEGANPDTYTVETENITLVNPTMDGHRFKGWKLYGSDEHDPLLNPAVIEKGTTGDLHFVAHWVGLVIVEFDSGVDGIIIDPEEIELEVKSPLPELPTPTREHYTFDGWYHEGAKIEEGYIVENDMSLLAKWTPVNYTITYDLDGGSADNPTTYTIEDAITLDDPTKEGFEFDGWTGTGLTVMTKNVAIPIGSYGPRSYTANWTEIFTVTFNGNGGTPASTTVDVRDGETVAEPAEPKRTDYVFKGWKLNGADYNFNTPVTGDITLKADWQVGKSTLNFDGATMGTKMKQLANPTGGITNGYSTTDTVTKAFARADKVIYDDAVSRGLVTDANKISTGDSIAATYMWFDSSTGTMYYYTEAAKVYVSGSMARMFAKYANLADFSGLKDFDTSGVNDMNRLFQDCPSLDDAALEYIKDWDVSNVVNMGFMFGANGSGTGNQITKLTALEDWDVSKVRSFQQLFKWATKLKILGELVDDPENPGTQIYNGLGKWNVSGVGYDASIPNANSDNKGFEQMFNYCSGLEDTSAIVDWDITNAITSAIANGQTIGWAFNGMLRNTPFASSQPAFSKWTPGGTWSNGAFTPNAAP